MELVRLAAAASQRDGVVRASRDHLILLQCTDAETVLVAASLVGQLTSDVGVWLLITDAYPAQLAARDVATLSAIVPLRHVAVEARAHSKDHADVLQSLLTNDEVNFTNDVARISGAYNRPAPPTPVTVWSYDQDRLVSGDDVLTKVRVEVRAEGELTYFA
ncbi:MAG: hypothetical protein ACYDB2_05950 [Acidimicrobiales bacterium]